MGEIKSSVPQEERQIFQQLNSVSMDIAYLKEDIASLEARLAPAMTPEGDCSEGSTCGEDPVPYTPRSQLAKQLESFSDSLMSLRRRVAYLHQNIEI